MLPTVVTIVAWAAVAYLTGVVASRRGHDRTLWVVLGAVFPVAALVALLLGFPRQHARVGRLAPDVEQALRESRVARLLAAEAEQSLADIGLRTGLGDEVIDKELGALKVLGLARRTQDDRWYLTPQAAAVLQDDTSGEV